MHALLLQALVGEQAEIPGHVRVIAFDSPRDFVEFAGSNVEGYYGHGFFGEPTIVLPLAGFRDHPDTIAHELAHHLSFFLFPVQPRWYSEGLAEFVQMDPLPLPLEQPGKAALRIPEAPVRFGRSGRSMGGRVSRPGSGE